MESSSPSLTHNQQIVLETLERSNGPMTAYNLLDELRPGGLRAPAQIYRALDRLMDTGRIHKLESLNAFIACRSRNCAGHCGAVFSLCSLCGSVREYTDAALDGALEQLVIGDGFHVRRSTTELWGLCAKCYNEDDATE